MKAGIPRLLKALVVFAALAVIGVLPYAYRVVRYAEAATRSTRQFRVSSLDSRVAYEPGAEAMAGVVAAAMPAAVDTVERKQYRAFNGPVRVYLCATVDSFAKYGASSRAAGFTSNHRVFLSPKPENTAERMPRILTHELSHLHLGENRGVLGLARLPVWFVEGLGTEVSAGGGAEGITDAEVRRTVAAGRTFVPDVDGALLWRQGAGAFNLDEHLFYAQAGAFVGYLRSLDERRFQSLLRTVEDGGALGDAFARAYGFPMDTAWGRFVQEAKDRSRAIAP